MAEAYTIDCCQYCNWSPKIFQQMREGGVDAVHVTICYHEDFRETVEEIVDWNRRFERHGAPDRHGADGIRHRSGARGGTHRRLLRPAERLGHRGRHRARRDPAHARRALHAAHLQQPVAARLRLLRGRGQRHHAHGARGDRGDEPRRHGHRHVAFRRALDARGDRSVRPADRRHARQPFVLAQGTAQQVRRAAEGARGSRRSARPVALPAPPARAARAARSRHSRRWWRGWRT